MHGNGRPPRPLRETLDFRCHPEGEIITVQAQQDAKAHSDTKSQEDNAPEKTGLEKTGLKPIRRALLSVTDKTGLVEFARALASYGVELVSTGGTARALRDAGLAVQDISELTGFPEMLDGRVKTLHPKVHGGILHIRDNPAHQSAVAEHGIVPIDMVVVNLYAFEKTASKPGVAFHEIVENIDIGGPSMVRSAAKNFEDVAIVTAASDYAALTQELAANNGSLGRETRWRLARHAFALTASYDSGIAGTLATLGDPAGEKSAL